MINPAFRKPLSFLARFSHDASGSVIVLAAGTMMTLMLLVGGGVEIHRRNVAIQQLQTALDTAVLAGKQRQAILTARNERTANEEGLKLAQQTFEANLKNSRSFASQPTATFSYTATGAMTGKSSPDYNLILKPLIPFGFATLNSVSEADYGVSLPTEIALVLDTTTSLLNKDGRMDTRFTLMRNAAKKFTHQIFDSAASSGQSDLVRVSVIPWSTTVNVLGAAPAESNYSGSSSVSSIYDGGSMKPVSGEHVKQGRDIIVNPSKFKPVTWRGCISGENDSPLTFDDTQPKKKLTALAVPPAVTDTATVQIGYAEEKTTKSCSCAEYGDDGKACWTGGRQGFLELIERTIPQISNAAALINPDLRREGGTEAEPACWVCTRETCKDVKTTVNNCSNSKKSIKYDPCNAWDFYGRQAAYRPLATPNCRQIWSSCYTEDEYDKAPKGAEACVADPNEPASQKKEVEWCAQYNDGDQWTKDIRIGGPNMNCPAPMLGLSGNRNQVIEYLDRMHPTPGGTHADVGLRWGLRTLSPQNDWPDMFGLKKSPGKFGDGASKIMILMTDGENEQAIDYPGYWGCQGSNYPSRNPSQPDCAGSPSRDELNERMLGWCYAIRSKYQVNLFAISMNVPGTASADILRRCTGDSTKVFSVDAADLSAVLTLIGNNIISMKLTK